MYKVLLETKTKSTVSTSMESITPAQEDSYAKAIQELQEEYENYRKEKIQTEKVLQEQLDKARDEASNLKIEYAKSTTKIDFLNGTSSLFIVLISARTL
jgi:nucleoprotein TPR